MLSAGRFVASAASLAAGARISSSPLLSTFSSAVDDIMLD
jgi:hypothetical protein